LHVDLIPEIFGDAGLFHLFGIMGTRSEGWKGIWFDWHVGIRDWREMTNKQLLEAASVVSFYFSGVCDVPFTSL